MTDHPSDEEREHRLKAAREAWHATDDAPEIESGYRLEDYGFGGNGLTPEFRNLSWSEIREIINEPQTPESWRWRFALPPLSVTDS